MEPKRAFLATLRRLSGLSIRSVLVGASALALLLFTPFLPASASAPSFPDVPGTHPYYAGISDLAGRNVISGYDDGTFRPDSPVWRQHFAKMIVGALALPCSEANTCPFADVAVGGSSTLYPDNYIAVAGAKGITQGTSPGRFSPTANITRAQVVTMIVRACGTLQPGLLVAPPPGFGGTLGNFDPIHGPNMRQAEFSGLLAGLVGFGSGWNPFAPASRGEVAQLLHNLMGLIAEGQGPDMGTAEVKLPNSAKLIATQAWGEVPPDQIGVILGDGKTRADADALAQTLGGTVVGEIEFLNAYQIETSGKTEADLKATLASASAAQDVELAFPNQQGSFSAEIWGVRQTPLNDPAYAGDFGKGYELIGAQKAWNYIRGSGLPLGNVQVGVIDDGLYEGTGEFGGEVNIRYPGSKAGKLENPEISTAATVRPSVV